MPGGGSSKKQLMEAFPTVATSQPHCRPGMVFAPWPAPVKVNQGQAHERFPGE